MADIVITAASVLPGSDANIDTSHLAGEAIIQGKTVYFDSTVKKWKLSDSNSATVEARKATGISLNSASLNQPIAVQKGGTITIGATMTAGLAYYNSDTPGGICPVADVGTGEYVEIIGVAQSTTVLGLTFTYPNVAL
jgi:hypothetical protein